MQKKVKKKKVLKKQEYITVKEMNEIIIKGLLDKLNKKK